jgi:hypothetical protein
MESPTDLVAECPTCKTAVAIDATECPRCGELFEREIVSDAPVAGREGASAPPDDESANETKTGFREKFLFYTGIFLILLGGPGIALGSWLHDSLRIAVGEFQAFDVFGPWNRLVTAIGLIVLIVGIVFLILSLRFSRPSDVERDLNALRES